VVEYCEKAGVAQLSDVYSVRLPTRAESLDACKCQRWVNIKKVPLAKGVRGRWCPTVAYFPICKLEQLCSLLCSGEHLQNSFMRPLVWTCFFIFPNLKEVAVDLWIF